MTEELRLAYVVHSLNLGGAEQLVVRMSKILAAECRVFILCLDEPGIWAEELRTEGIPVHCLWRQPGLDLGVAWRIAAFCRHNNVDIIHAHQVTPWHYAALSRLFYRQPRLVFEEHGRHYPEVESIKRKWFNRLVGQRLTHSITAVSRDIKDRLVSYEGISAAAIQVVYNGTDQPALISPAERDELRTALGFSPEDFVVGTVGRFDPIKNLPLLVKGIDKARHRNKPIKGLLIGDGPVMAEIRNMIDSLGLRNEIELVGYRRDARRIMQVLDLFVLPSFSEGTSMALLEAMAAGIPCLVTDVGGNPEIVLNNETGWVVPSDNLEAMSGAMVEASSQPDKLKRFAEAGEGRFRERFSMEAMMADYRQIYFSLIR